MTTMPLLDERHLSAEAVLASLDFSEDQLDNGLRLVIIEDHRLPLAAVNLWYGVGSRNEEPGRTGFAHLFEHLMFEGSTNVAPGEHRALLARLGAQMNASTSTDETRYYELVPEHGVELALWLEADRMGGHRDALTQERFDVQRGVVRNERRERYENQPYGTAVERLLAMVFPEGHPYRHPPIGSMDDLDAATVDDAAAFHAQWYTPGNAHLVVAGDVDRQQVREWVETFFGGIDPGAPRPADRDGAIPFDFGGVVRQDVHERVPTPRLFMAFRAPARGSAAGDALKLGTTSLTAGRGARARNRLVRERQVASDVSIGTMGLTGGVDVLLANASPREGVDMATLEAELLEVLRSLVEEPTTERDRQRLLPSAAVELRAVREQVAVLADAVNFGAVRLNDPWSFAGGYDRMASVTEDAVAEIVAAVTTDANRAVLTYYPEAHA